jgi:beta-phosphoglucomutase-like phosphatase (HAD superfamily)
VTASLRALRLLEKFETLVCAGDYQRGKPDPEAFLIAAARLALTVMFCVTSLGRIQKRALIACRNGF